LNQPDPVITLSTLLLSVGQRHEMTKRSAQQTRSQADFVFDKRQGQRATVKRHRRNRHHEKELIRKTFAHLP